MSRPNEHKETCGCGARYQLKHKDRHLDKSAKHARWLENRVANSNIVQNNTNNHVGQQTYNNISNNSNINNYVEYPTYYNNTSYDNNEYYNTSYSNNNYVQYTTYNNEYYDADYYNTADMY